MEKYKIDISELLTEARCNIADAQAILKRYEPLNKEMWQQLEKAWHECQNVDAKLRGLIKDVPPTTETNLLPCGCPMDKTECKECTRFS